jgi:hypothetical protein
VTCAAVVFATAGAAPQPAVHTATPASQHHRPNIATTLRACATGAAPLDRCTAAPLVPSATSRSLPTRRPQPAAGAPDPVRLAGHWGIVKHGLRGKGLPRLSQAVAGCRSPTLGKRRCSGYTPQR